MPVFLICSFLSTQDSYFYNHWFVSCYQTLFRSNKPIIIFVSIAKVLIYYFNTKYASHINNSNRQFFMILVIFRILNSMYLFKLIPHIIVIISNCQFWRSVAVSFLFLKCPFSMKHGHKMVYDKMKQVCTILWIVYDLCSTLQCLRLQEIHKHHHDFKVNILLVNIW